MNKPDSRIRLHYGRQVIVRARMQSACEISQARHAGEGGEAVDNATGSTLGQLGASVGTPSIPHT